MEDPSIIKIKKLLSTYNSPKRENKKNIKEYKDNIIFSEIPINNNYKEEYSSEDLDDNSKEEYNYNNINIYLDKIIDNLSEIQKISIEESKRFLDKIKYIKYKIKKREERKTNRIKSIAFFIATIGVLISFYYFK